LKRSVFLEVPAENQFAVLGFAFIFDIAQYKFQSAEVASAIRNRFDYRYIYRLQ
jgi:hypothetical protein